MSMDKTLKLSSRMQRHRSVLSRSERIARLREEGRWQDGRSIFGLPKVRVMRAKRRGKAAPKPEEAQAEAAAAPAAPAATGAPGAETVKKK